MNRTLAQIDDQDIEEIAGLVEWYMENTSHYDCDLRNEVTADVLATIEQEDPDKANSLDETTVREIVRIVATVMMRSDS
jgi:hypothetical protein